VATPSRCSSRESLTFAVPNGISPKLAALTEPMSVGWHAVRRSGIGKRDTAIVIGCGPIGLAVIGMLAARGRAAHRGQRLLPRPGARSHTASAHTSWSTRP